MHVKIDIILNFHVESNFFSLFDVTWSPTECVKDLDSQNKLLIFELILTTFIPSIILEAAGAVLKIGMSRKPNHHRKFSLPKTVKRSVRRQSNDVVNASFFATSCIAERDIKNNGPRRGSFN